jgi:hypothetical protein
VRPLAFGAKDSPQFMQKRMPGWLASPQLVQLDSLLKVPVMLPILPDRRTDPGLSPADL